MIILKYLNLTLKTYDNNNEIKIKKIFKLLDSKMIRKDIFIFFKILVTINKNFFILFNIGYDKVWEIFMDFNLEEFYVNRIYLDDITYSDVRIDRHYAILMSDSAHRIIAHSVYREFADSSLWEKHRYFN